MESNTRTGAMINKENGKGKADGVPELDLGAEPLAFTDGGTTIGLGEQPRPVLFADDPAAGATQPGQHAPLYVAVAYASTPRHIDGRPVAGSRTLQGKQVLSSDARVGSAWDAKYTRAGLQLR